MKLNFTELKHGTSTLGKNNIYAKASVPPSWSQNLPVIQQAGQNNGWNNLKMETEKYGKSHLEKEGLKIEFFSKSMVSSDSPIGIAHFPLAMATQKPNEWVTVPAQINLQGQFAGKCMMQARFASDETILAQGLADEEARQSLKMSNDALQKRVAQLEQSLRQQLHKEIVEERDALLEKMKLQNAELKGMLENALKKMKKSKEEEEKKLVAETPDQEMPDISDVQLPKNISRWRAAHVQAWLAFCIGLPQYIEPFADASIDGLLLLKHIDHKHLKEFLKIDNEMHRTKILLGIQQLKEKQSKYDQLLEQRRKEKEAERLRRLQREEEERKRKEAKDKKKKKNMKPMPTMSKPDFIDNGINRVKLEKTLKDQNQLLREKQKKLAEQYQRYNKTWQFEYTGSAKPEEKDAMLSDTIWNRIDRSHGNHLSKPELGSKAYQKTMKGSILQEVTPVQREIREIPKTCSTDEVLAIVKGAMFEVSNWLLKVEEMNYKKQYLLDNDLDEFVLEDIDEEMLNMEFADDDELPPSYSNYLDETNSIPNPSLADAGKGVGTASGIAAVADDEPPPDYEEVLQSKEVVPITKAEDIDLLSPTKEQGSIASLLPAPNVNIPLPPSNSDQNLPPTVQTKSRKRQQLTELLLQSQQPHLQYQTLAVPPPYETDRMKLIFRSFVDQTNNKARWLGNNQKLTRLKLEGGIENLLKLKLSWEQFDMLWTRLDYKRSGDLDYHEFVQFFGDLNEFLTHEGMNHLTLTRGMTTAPNTTQYYNAQGQAVGGAKDEEMKLLVEYLYYFVDTLRKTNFTIIEIFSSFDRNGSGDISLSEFCSLLRLVLGPQFDDQHNKKFDRKMIYRALNILDVDGNKSISLQELLFFIYRIWKTQLQDLANEISHVTTELHQTATNTTETGAPAVLSQQQQKANQKRKDLIQKLLQEREDIKSAVKRNYPRHWRDKLERLGMETNTIPGPFTHLLNQMHIIAEESADPNFTSTANAQKQQQQPLSVDTIKNDDFTNFFTGKGKTSDNDPTLMLQTAQSPQFMTQQPSSSPQRFGGTGGDGTGNPAAAYLSASSPTKKPGRTYLSGHNSLLRFKIRLPAGQPPVRTSTHSHQPMKLAVPNVTSLDNNPNMITGENTHKILNEFDYMAGMMK